MLGPSFARQTKQLPGWAMTPWTGLTPQKLRIARLAAIGMTNREIGLLLFLSHRTVGCHLHGIFPKLGITSQQPATRGWSGHRLVFSLFKAIAGTIRT